MNERNNNISPLSFLKSLAPQERFSASLAVYLLLLLASPVTGLCADYYAAPAGTASAAGTKSNPWDLATALSKTGVVSAGDTLWLRGGTYSGTFTSNLAGSASAPVTVRQYSGERAVIDGSPSSNPPLTVYGSYVWFWGLEVMNSDPKRVSAQTGSAPTDLKRGIGVWVEAPNSKFINMVVHDTSQGFGFWTPASDSEIYGSIIYSNGWDAPDRGHGHGIYVQNQTGAKQITDNIIFNQFSHGVHAYTEGGNIDNITVQGNIIFNSGLLSAVTGNIRNILVGGGQVAHNPSVLSNYTYFNPGTGNNYLGYGVGCQNLTATSNYFAGATALTLGPCPGAAITSNTFYGATSGLSGFPSNVFLTSRPTGVNVLIRPNRYEPGRANIAVFDWSLQSTVGIDPSGILAVGDSYEILDVQNYFGSPVLKGTYNGGLIQLPTGSTAITPPIGNAPVIPVHTSPEFGSYVLLRTSPTTGVNQPPVVNAGPAQTITLPSSATLTGVATDDGLPNNTLTTTWKVVSGPGTVVFGNANALATTASFSTAGA